MLDSWAGGNFMDIEFAQGNNIQMRNIAAPIDRLLMVQDLLPMKLFLLNSKLRQTFVRISGFQQIVTQIVLGIPWFSTLNPSIN